MNMLSLVNTFSQVLEKNNHDNPKRTIEELIAYHLNCNPLEIYNHSLKNSEIIKSDIHRLLENEPLQYIIGNVDFFGLNFTCDKRALIPRSETEILVESVINSKVFKKNYLKITDVGTGSGCISVTLANKNKNVHIDAIDLSIEALELAKENAKKNDVLENINFINEDLLTKRKDNFYNMVISNPPYISTHEMRELPKSVKEFEPVIALEAGTTGLEIYQSLVYDAYRVLQSSGSLFLEVGHKQCIPVKELLIKAGFKNIKIIKDYNNHERVLVAEKNE